MFKVLLPEAFLEAERAHWQKFKGFINTNNWDNSLAEDDTRLKNPFVDASSIGKVCPSFGSRKGIMRFIKPILHDRVFPEPR